ELVRFAAVPELGEAVTAVTRDDDEIAAVLLRRIDDRLPRMIAQRRIGMRFYACGFRPLREAFEELLRLAHGAFLEAVHRLHVAADEIRRARYTVLRARSEESDAGVRPARELEPLLHALLGRARSVGGDENVLVHDVSFLALRRCAARASA